MEDTEQTAHFLAGDMLALSKLNWNNAQFDGGWPITARAAQDVGAILKHVPRADLSAARYSYYM